MQSRNRCWIILGLVLGCGARGGGYHHFWRSQEDATQLLSSQGARSGPEDQWSFAVRYGHDRGEDFQPWPFLVRIREPGTGTGKTVALLTPDADGWVRGRFAVERVQVGAPAYRVEVLSVLQVRDDDPESLRLVVDHHQEYPRPEAANIPGGPPMPQEGVELPASADGPSSIPGTLGRRPRGPLHLRHLGVTTEGERLWAMTLRDFVPPGPGEIQLRGVGGAVLGSIRVVADATKGLVALPGHALFRSDLGIGPEVVALWFPAPAPYPMEAGAAEVRQVPDTDRGEPSGELLGMD